MQGTMRVPLPALIVAIVPALASCHSQTNAVASPQVPAIAASAPQCVPPGEMAESFAVDWPSERRADLEIALKRSVVVLHATCSSVRILPDCSADAAYTYIGTTEREDLVSLRSADDVRANLPLSASSLTGPTGVDFPHGSSLDLGMASVGRRSTLRASILRSDLKGECGGATHFVRAVTLGAFAMASGAAGQAKTAADVFGRTGGGSGAQWAKDGALDACRASRSDADSEMAQCGAPVRVTLTAIREPGVAPPPSRPAAPTCPAGMVTVESGVCQTPRPDVSHICAFSDIPDCTLQCAHGSPTSCSILGRSYAIGRGVPQDLGRATELLDKACAAGVQPACGRLGELALASHDEAKGLPLLTQACFAGWTEGCLLSGRYAVKHPSVKVVDEVTSLRRSCLGGLGEGCWSLGRLYLDGPNGLPKSDVEAARWLRFACEADANEGCSDYAMLLDDGRGVARDPAGAVSLLTSACDAGHASACDALANDYFLAHSVPQDPTKGMALLERACSYGDSKTCFDAGRRYQLGNVVPRDPAKAMVLLTKACEAGVRLACTAAGKKP